MSQIGLIFRKEWRYFVGSDRGMFVIYFVLVAFWGLMLAQWLDGAPAVMPFGLAMFSVIVGANFSNSVFVSERVSGTLELLLTSGVTRGGILYGKMAFVFCMTLGIGVASIGLAVAIKYLASADQVVSLVTSSASGCILYGAASFMNAASSAYLSIMLPNPRLLHFINILIVGSAASVPLIAAGRFPHAFALTAAIMVGAGAILTALARREFGGERITKPVIF